MENTKDSKQLLDELKTLLEVRKNLIGVDKINGVIADKAEEFVKTLYTEIDDEVKKTFEPSVVPKKSEMPCNCHKEEPELKPCPFCGSKEVEMFTTGQGDEPIYPRILCSGCDTMFKIMGNHFSEYLVQHWNTRKAEIEKADSVQEKIVKAVLASVKNNLPPDTKITVFTIDDTAAR